METSPSIGERQEVASVQEAISEVRATPGPMEQEPVPATPTLHANVEPVTPSRGDAERGVPKAEISGGPDHTEDRSRADLGSGHDSADVDLEGAGEGSSQAKQDPEGGAPGGDGRAEGNKSGVQGTTGGFAAFAGGGVGWGAGDWRGVVFQRIERAKRYPARARRLGMEGITEVQFRITGHGSVEGVAVVKSSGFPLLDEASVETIKRAAPFPPIPGTIRIPISYRLRDLP